MCGGGGGRVVAGTHQKEPDMTSSITPQFRTIEGLKIRFAESEARDQHALLLSPWPESLYAFDRIWGQLAQRAHLVAVDLPGFGHSERRDALLAPRAMGEFVIRLADAFGLDNPHAVGPDVGTGALLFAAADNPGRLRTLVVGSGGASFPLELGGILHDFVTTPDIDPYRAADPRAIVKGAMTGVERYQIPDHIAEDYLSAYEGDRFVESMRYVRAYPAELPVLGPLLPTITTPVQIIGGLWDSKVPPSNNRFLHQRLPHSKLDLLDAAHFTWEDAPEDYAELVTSWWASSPEQPLRPGA
jgi:pimeloyl-ACP methyl ester carboxylesterase